MRRLRDLMTWGCFARYAAWRLSGSREPFHVRLRSGEQFWVRPSPAGDLGVARQMFLDDDLAWPAEVPSYDPKRIVDAGANVGISLVLWAYRFPTAQLVAYEPHPAHVEMVNRQVELNRLGGRTRVVPAAIATSAAQGRLKSDGAKSFVTASDEADTIAVPLVDFFEDVGAAPFDLLKLDIEGGEYAILGDDRFARLKPRRIALEWHTRPEVPDGRGWCVERLKGLGYQVTDGNLQHDGGGMLWAWQ